MGDFDVFVFLGIAAFIGFVFYRQISSYLNYKKELNLLLENQKDLKISYYLTTRILFIGLMLVAIVYFLFFTEEESRYIAALLMVILAINEVIAIFMFGRIFSNKDLFFFNGKTVRYRNIKEIVKKRGPLVAKITLMTNEEVAIPKKALSLVEKGLEDYRTSRKKRK